MNCIIITIILSMIIFCLGYLRFIVVSKSAEDWNYMVYRYEKYCTLHNQYCEDFEANRLNDLQVFIVFLMFWKAIPRFFFDNCPDWADIDELIQNGSL